MLRSSDAVKLLAFAALASPALLVIVASSHAEAGRAPSALRPLPQAPATPSVQGEPSMTVEVVTAGAGCDAACPQWIAAQGQIDSSTPARFRAVLGRLGGRKLPILVHSRGGAVNDAMVIARMIRAAGLDVVVGRTEHVAGNCAGPVEACGKASDQKIVVGRPNARAAICASSCSLLIAGGVHRYVHTGAAVGVHQIIVHMTQSRVMRTYRVERRMTWSGPVEVRRTLVKEKVLDTREFTRPAETSMYQKVEKFYAEMGIAPEIMPLWQSAPNTGVHWMSRAELQTTHLATDFQAGDAALGALPPPSGPTTTAASEVAPGAAPGPARHTVKSGGGGHGQTVAAGRPVSSHAAPPRLPWEH